MVTHPYSALPAALAAGTAVNAKERSPFHARRLAGLDLSLATAADLAPLRMTIKVRLNIIGT
jgi:hypothetical protein